MAQKCKTCGDMNDDKSAFCSGCNSPLKPSAGNGGDDDLESMLGSLGIKSDKKTAAKKGGNDMDFDLNLDDDQIFKDLGAAKPAAKGKTDKGDIFQDLSSASPKGDKGKSSGIDDIFAELDNFDAKPAGGAKKTDAKSKDNIFDDLDLGNLLDGTSSKPAAKPAAKSTPAKPEKSAAAEPVIEKIEIDGFELEIDDGNIMEMLAAKKKEDEKAKKKDAAHDEHKESKKFELAPDEIDISNELLGISGDDPFAGLTSKAEPKPEPKAEPKPAPAAQKAEPAKPKKDDDIFAGLDDLSSGLELDEKKIDTSNDDDLLAGLLGTPTKKETAKPAAKKSNDDLGLDSDFDLGDLNLDITAEVKPKASEKPAPAKAAAKTDDFDLGDLLGDSPKSGKKEPAANNDDDPFAGLLINDTKPAAKPEPKAAGKAAAPKAEPAKTAINKESENLDDLISDLMIDEKPAVKTAVKASAATPKAEPVKPAAKDDFSMDFDLDSLIESKPENKLENKLENKTAASEKTAAKKDKPQELSSDEFDLDSILPPSKSAPKAAEKPAAKNDEFDLGDLEIEMVESKPAAKTSPAAKTAPAAKSEPVKSAAGIEESMEFDLDSLIEKQPKPAASKTEPAKPAKMDLNIPDFDDKSAVEMDLDSLLV